MFFSNFFSLELNECHITYNILFDSSHEYFYYKTHSRKRYKIGYYPMGNCENNNLF